MEKSNWIGKVAVVMVVIAAATIFSGVAFGVQNPNLFEKAGATTAEQVLIAKDAKSLQGAIDALPKTGGVVVIPAQTTIKLSTTLKMFGKSNVTLRGQGRTSVLQWTAGTAGTIVRLGSLGKEKGFDPGYGINLEKVRFDGGKKATLGLHIAALKAPGHENDPNHYHGYTGNILINDVTVENMAINAEGIRIGHLSGKSTEAEIKLRDVKVKGCYLGVRVTSPWASNIIFDGCYISRCSYAAIRFEDTGGGPFVLQNCVFGMNGTDIITEIRSAFTLSEIGSYGGEHSRHLYVKHIKNDERGEHEKTFPNITIIGTNFGGWPKDTDGITWETGGSLTLIGNGIRTGKIHIEPDAEVKDGVMRFYDVMNRYQTTGMLKISPKVVMYSGLSANDWFQDRQWVGMGAGKSLVEGGTHGGFALTPGQSRPAIVNTRGISATTIASNNLRGAVTISGSATSAKVTFKTPEPDVKYFPIVQVAGTAGTPAVGATRVFATELTKNGFTVNTETAPGVENSVNVCWVMLR